MKKRASRNRSALAKAQGRRLVAFTFSADFDALISRVRDALAAEQGTCTRVQALERMGREGAKKFLGDEKPEVLTG